MKIVLVPPRITLLSTRKSTFRDEKKQASFPFHSGNPTTFSSIFNFQFSDSMTSASVSASKPLLLLFHSAISLSLINQAFFLFSRSFSGLEKELGRAWCLGCMEWMQLQKKKQDQTNFFEIHLTLLHVFYVLFHSDTWMGLGGTRTPTVLVPPRITLLSTRQSTFWDEKKPSLFPFS